VGSLWAAGLLLRRLRTELGMIALLFLVVTMTSFLFAATPLLLNRTDDDGLRSAANVAAPVRRDVLMSLAASLSPGTDGGVTEIHAYGDRLADRLPAVLAALVSDQSMSVTTVRFAVVDPPAYPTYLSLRYQDGLTDQTRLVSGRWPVDQGVALPPAGFAVDFGSTRGDGALAEPIVLEVALSTATAAEIRVGVGDRLSLMLDGSDPLLPAGPIQVGPTEVQVVGLYEPIDVAASYWSGDASLAQVSQIGTFFNPVALATAYVPAAMYPNLWTSTLPFRYEWRFGIDPQRLDAGDVGELQGALRHLDLNTSSTGTRSQDTVTVRSGLLAIVDQFVEQRAASESILAVAAIGPLTLAAVALGMIAVLLVTRRRAILALARGRGASGRLVLGTQLLEAVLLAGAASLLGLLAAVSIVPARGSPLSAVSAFAVGGAAVLVLVGATWPIARRPLGQLGRDDQPALRVAPRRLVLELTFVCAAVAGALLLRQRGITVDAAEGVAEFNPLLAAVPVLLGLAAGIVAMRIYPLPIRGLGRIAAGRRDLVPVLGLRTIGRQPAAANLPLLVLMLAAAFGAFSSVIVTSIDKGQVVTSYLEVGADYRIERIAEGALPESLDPASIAGVEAVARGRVESSAAFAHGSNMRAAIHLEVVDPGAYAAVAEGTPADPHWPTSFLAAPSGTGIGTEDNPIPAILSARLPSGSSSLSAGDTFGITVYGQPMTFRLVEQRADLPGFTGIGTFAVVPLSWVEAGLGNRHLPTTVLWIRARTDAAAPLAEAVAIEGVAGRLVSRPAAYAALHDGPLGVLVARGLLLALVIGAAYMAITIIGAMVLSATRRTQDLAYLRTLGVTNRQALGLTVVEHGPPVVLALVAGVALGVGVAYLLQPGLGLAAFVGLPGVPLFIDWRALGLVAVIMVGVVAAAVTIGTWLSRRARLVDALRIGDD
jgi:putative ABC transport system permease protein